MKRVFRTFLFLGVMLWVGCTLQKSIQRAPEKLRLLLVKKAPQKHTDSAKTRSSEERFRVRGRKDSLYLIPKAEGEGDEGIRIDAVEVTAKFRSVAERHGEVEIAYRILIPKLLMRKSRELRLTPFVHLMGETKTMGTLVLRGTDYDLLQKRQYWQWQTWKRRFHPGEDSLLQKRFVRLPHHELCRIDSVTDSKENISFHLFERIKLKGDVRKLSSTLEAWMEDVEARRCRVPVHDTLHFTISSMLGFVDETERFVKHIRLRHNTHEENRHIVFGVGSSKIVDSLGKNREELEKVLSLTDSLLRGIRFSLDSCTVEAFSSPEGNFEKNMELSRARARSVVRRLKENFGEDTDTVFISKSSGENWKGFLDAVEKRDKRQGEILRQLDKKHSDKDVVLRLFEGRLGAQYKKIRDEIFPPLREVRFRFFLRDLTMTRDTILSSQIDTLYRRGVELLKRRDYPKALKILRHYPGINTVIAHMSLSHDSEALELLQKERPSAKREYLRAMLLVRLGRMEEAREAFERSCEWDASMDFRADMDPEMTKLKNYMKR